MTVNDLRSEVVDATSNGSDKDGRERVQWLMGNETDRLSLLAIKAKIIEDPLYALSSWNDSIHFCQWQGVTCSRRHQRVTALDLHSQELVGSISPHLGNLSFLRELLIQNNSFGDEIPPEIGCLPRLQILQLSNDLIGGQIAINISRCANLISIDFSHNGFVGEVPVELGSLLKLEIVITEANNLRGSIFPFVNLSSLRNLYLDNNYFNIEWKSSLGLGNHSPNLELFGINENQFTGSIPVSISNASKLYSLETVQNKLTGKVPNLSRLQNLERLLLANNQLGFGEADDLNFTFSLINATNLHRLEVNINNFGCKFLEYIGNLSRNLEYLNIDHNHIFGIIPPGILNHVGLQSLNMQFNQFTGTIPREIGNLQNLRRLNLDDNSLSGVVPTQGVFSNASEISVVGNTKLCGGVAELKLPKCNLKVDEKRRSNSALALALSIPFGFVGLALMGCALYRCWFRKRRKDTPSYSSKNLLLRVSYQTLVKATDGFSSFNLIGVGSFGSVYKGVIDGRIVAVKVLTACSTIDYQGHDFKALVYEFMVNGSLEEWLHQNCNEDLSNEEFKKLNLLQRLNIIIDVSCALNYLHNQAQSPIVHCDLKPSNILLDKDMTGHVGDFGLGKFLAHCYKSLLNIVRNLNGIFF
ncbi:probable LRR receptor-like serine/threonine-protein kinase At3g47570 [Camellia sinensis]|uniref:probable LRR receptor-like serine/threonine-protein kinase At3g47570 n=1 Tax=Camellia sinensis TaxID=4442 RepID=UPI0010355919|nr:probable LRR receptor-like serine/threonine-protein kinase At3g47570 [Camellia sinensis]